MGPRDERAPFKASRKPRGTNSLTRWLRQHLVQEHARPPRAVVPPCAGATSPPWARAASPPRAGEASPRWAGAAASPRAGATSPYRAWQTRAAAPSRARRAGGGGTSSLPCFLDGSIDDAMHALKEEEALGFTSW
jgi:hypothetical protein